VPALPADLGRDGLLGERVAERKQLRRLLDDELRRAEAEAQAFKRGMWGATASGADSADAVPVPIASKKKAPKK